MLGYKVITTKPVIISPSKPNVVTRFKTVKANKGVSNIRLKTMTSDSVGYFKDEGAVTLKKIHVYVAR